MTHKEILQSLTGLSDGIPKIFVEYGIQLSSSDPANTPLGGAGTAGQGRESLAEYSVGFNNFLAHPISDYITCV